MKKLILSLFIAGTATFASAQCAKTGTPACCAKTATTAVAGKSNTMVASAEDKLAAEQNIQKRVSESGKANYYEKSVCAQSGSVTWNEVAYDAKENKFTRVASASMEKDAQGVAKPAAKKCEKAGSSCCKDSKKVN
jgi:hypothetical protein